MGVEHIVAVQLEIAQLRSGRNNHLMLRLIGCQGELQGTGGSLEPTTGGSCAINGNTCICHRCHIG